jgi:hypothetical protein
VYTCAAGLGTAMVAHPTSLTCAQDGSGCGRAIDTKGFAEAVSWLPWSCGTIGLTALGLAAVSLWYAFELAFLDKKANKHTRRHRHNKHHIPWHKLKVVGPAINCGSGGNAGKTGSKTGGCPVMH